MRSLNERAVGLKEGKTKWRRKAYSSRERFLSNREPRSSQSLWFIIILGISHSCPTFCIRILKTEFVLPKVSSGFSSSSRSSACCSADLQCTIRTEVYCQQTYGTFFNWWTWNRAQPIKISTNLGFIVSKITCLFGPEMMDILCGCISHHRRFRSFLGRFVRPPHNTRQT